MQRKLSCAGTSLDRDRQTRRPEDWLVQRNERYSIRTTYATGDRPPALPDAAMMSNGGRGSEESDLDRNFITGYGALVPLEADSRYVRDLEAAVDDGERLRQ